MGWSPYVESEAVKPEAGVTDESMFRATLLCSLTAIHTELKLLNARFEELGGTNITKEDVS